MFENDYYTARNYEGNNNLYINDFDKNINNRRSNTQNYFFNNDPNDMNEDEFNYPTNNLNDDFLDEDNDEDNDFENNENVLNMNQDENQYNGGIEVFKNRINKLQRKVGKLNRYRNEIQQAINYNVDNNNLNRTQNYLDNYENNYFEENEKPGLKFNKSFDVFKTNYNNYDFLFDSQNNNNFEQENNSSDNYIEQEEDKFNNEDTNNIINLPNNNFDMNYNNQDDDNSFVGFYDNIFTTKNINVDLNEHKANNLQNNIPINDSNKKNDYKNIQLYEQNYQFNIPKTTNNNVTNENTKENKIKNNNIQIVSNELSIIKNELKENNNNNFNIINNNNDNNNLIKIPKKDEMNNDEVFNQKNNELKMMDEMRQKELEKYDSIIAQAKELNNQFQTEKNSYELKNNGLKDNNEIINKIEYKIQKGNNDNIDKNKIDINPETNNILNLKSKEKKRPKVIDKNKKVSFVNEKIYIKYNQDDYIVKINVFNHKKEKIDFVTHDLKKYINKLRKKEYLEPAIINCPEIDYQLISNKMINLVKKENKVQSQKPRIDNKINKSVKNTRIKLPINKQENRKEIRNNLKVDKIKKMTNNNIKLIKNNQIAKTEKNIKAIPQCNFNKAKIIKKEKMENKQIKKKETSKNKNQKIENNNNLDIFDNPQFKEGQRAINNLKKFFAEYSLEDEKNE